VRRHRGQVLKICAQLGARNVRISARAPGGRPDASASGQNGNSGESMKSGESTQQPSGPGRCGADRAACPGVDRTSTPTAVRAAVTVRERWLRRTGSHVSAAGPSSCSGRISRSEGRSEPTSCDVHGSGWIGREITRPAQTRIPTATPPASGPAVRVIAVGHASARRFSASRRCRCRCRCWGGRGWPVRLGVSVCLVGERRIRSQLVVGLPGVCNPRRQRLC
jgi:hypothetical protein